MKHALAAVIGIVFSFTLCYAADKAELKDQKDRESYSLGYRFGQSLRSQGVDIDLQVYNSGIRDALEGIEPLMSKEEIGSTITELRQRVAAEQQKSMKEEGEKNLAAGKAFMEENAKKDGVKTLPSGLQYKVLTEGTGKKPNAVDAVTVHYRGTFIDGKEFDSSRSRGQPATFKVNGVVKGWSEALQLMKEGAKWQLFIPPALAYGERGMPPHIPPQSTLIFEVELITVQ